MYEEANGEAIRTWNHHPPLCVMQKITVMISLSIGRDMLQSSITIYSSAAAIVASSSCCHHHHHHHIIIPLRCSSFPLPSDASSHLTVSKPVVERSLILFSRKCSIITLKWRYHQVYIIYSAGGRQMIDATC